MTNLELLDSDTASFESFGNEYFRIGLDSDLISTYWTWSSTYVIPLISKGVTECHRFSSRSETDMRIDRSCRRHRNVCES